MKKEIKSESAFSVFRAKKLKIIIDKNMKPVKPTGAIARKIEEVNEAFSKFKSINDILPPQSASE